MEELNQISQELYDLLEKKSVELAQADTKADSYIISELDNRKREIDIFSERAGLVNVSPVERAGVIASFRDGAETIKKKIASIGETKS
jgi:NADP-dependent 3-hydroxy acid dehydrogenase YdfG